MALSRLPALAGLNPSTRQLSPSDLDSCVVVENAFVEHERCSKEKLLYRLSTCPELSLGVFITEKGGSRLVGHVLATYTASDYVTEGSMEMPAGWQPSSADDQPAVVNGQVIGNDKTGRSVAVHSLAVDPAYQGKGVGRALMDDYIQYIRSSPLTADRIVLLAHDYLIRFYESVGFQNEGPSQCQFGGGGWFDLVLKP